MLQRRGLPKNDAEAAKWLLSAGQQGHVEAQYLLGRFYSQGIGVPNDEDAAVAWYRKLPPREMKEPARTEEVGLGIADEHENLETAWLPPKSTESCRQCSP